MTQTKREVVSFDEDVLLAEARQRTGLTSFAKPGNAALPDTDPNKDLYITWLVVDPVITLWNPYNVNLRFSGGRIDFYRVPLMFRLYKNNLPSHAE